MASSMNTYVDNNVKEESGWTEYLEDFSLNQKAAATNMISTSSSNNSSMVSDAAWNGFNGNYTTANPLLKRLNFKINKSTAGLVKHDDDLEDTASSPVNSPKVKEMDHVNCRTPDTFGHLLGKEKAGETNFSDIERKEKNGGSEEGGYADLKKMGLCVVPMSVLVNYIGSA